MRQPAYVIQLDLQGILHRLAALDDWAAHAPGPLAALAQRWQRLWASWQDYWTQDAAGQELAQGPLARFGLDGRRPVRFSIGAVDKSSAARQLIALAQGQPPLSAQALWHARLELPTRHAARLYPPLSRQLEALGWRALAPTAPHEQLRFEGEIEGVPALLSVRGADPWLQVDLLARPPHDPAATAQIVEAHAQAAPPHSAGPLVQVHLQLAALAALEGALQLEAARAAQAPSPQAQREALHARVALAAHCIEGWQASTHQSDTRALQLWWAAVAEGSSADAARSSVEAAGVGADATGSAIDATSSAADTAKESAAESITAPRLELSAPLAPALEAQWQAARRPLPWAHTAGWAVALQQGFEPSAAPQLPGAPALATWLQMRHCALGDPLTLALASLPWAGGLWPEAQLRALLPEALFPPGEGPTQRGLALAPAEVAPGWALHSRSAMRPSQAAPDWQDRALPPEAAAARPAGQAPGALAVAQLDVAALSRWAEALWADPTALSALRALAPTLGQWQLQARLEGGQIKLTLQRPELANP